MGKVEAMVKMYVENDCNACIKNLFYELNRFGLIDNGEILHFIYITRGWHRDGEYIFDTEGVEVYRVSDKAWFGKYMSFGSTALNLCICPASEVVGWKAFAE